MKERSMKSLFISLMVVTAMLLQPMIPLVQLGLRSHLWQFGSRVAQAEEGPTNTIYLPVVTSPPGPPAFEIISPADGATISGVMYFAVQTSDANSISSVTFMAGDTTLGTDTTPADGLRTFLDVSELPAGDVELSAMATGANGETSKSITVNVVPNPPSSGTVEEDGGVFASEIGSVITIPPGGAPDGTTVSVTEMTQEEVTAQNGFDWDAMGVTFLGAQDIESSADFSGPLGVASADFGNRVQPGQAVVNYQIMPDADGDGVDELVVVNTASVAPNNDVISDPVPQVQVVGAIETTSASGTFRRSVVGGISGPSGTFVEMEVSGFNPYSAEGNMAIFESSVDGTIVEVVGIVRPPEAGRTEQVLSFVIPILPSGPASLTLRNESTASTLGPMTVMIEESAPLTRPATEVIDEYLTQSMAFLSDLEKEMGQELPSVNAIIDELNTVQPIFQKLGDDPSETVQQYLTDVATMIENSGIIGQLESGMVHSLDYLGGCVPPTRLKVAKFFYGTSGILFGAACALAFTGAGAVICGAGVAITFLAGQTFWLDGFKPCPDPPETPTCSPSPAGGGGGGGGSSLRHQRGGGGTTTGMGAAPPPGGDGCGSASGGSSGGLRAVAQQAGRYLIKIRVGGSFTPFTGMSDAGGYFYVPFIPEDEPFRAFAFDSITGETRTFEGVGPATGDSLVMFFNFAGVDDTATAIEIGQVVTGEITQTGQLDFYTFNAAAGQQVFFDVQDYEALGLLNWQVLDREANTIFDTCLGCGDPGVYTLDLGGTYTLLVGEKDETLTGTYQFQMWDVPPADEFSIAIGDVISDGVPGPGAGNIETPGVKDIYTFNATAGQRVFFDMQDQQGIGLINWRVMDEEGTEIFNTCLGCGDPGVYTLEAGGSYTMRVGDDGDDATGTYQLQLWNVPAPDEFSIAIGDSVSDGMPAAGAGNIESPGVEDIYTFNATAGQRVFFDIQDQEAIGLVNWRVVDEEGTEIFNTCLGCGEPGVYTLEAGTYTMSVGDYNDDGYGTYQIQLWDVPAADEFSIAIGDTVSDGVPGAGAGNIESPGVKDIYTFNATAGQEVNVDVLTQDGVGLVNWRVVDEDGTEIFNTCLGCGDPGAYSLTLGGTYTITVGDDGDDNVGTYSFQISEP